MPALLIHPPSGGVHLASLVALSPSCPRPQAPSSAPHIAPRPPERANPPKTRHKLSLASPPPFRGRAGERQFPLSSPRMDHALDSQNALR